MTGGTGSLRAHAGWRADAAAALVTAVGCVLLGAPVGLLWAAVTPRVQLSVTAAGATLVDAGTKSFIAADGFFLGLGLLAGMLTGLAAWWLGRGRGPGLVVGLLVGGLLAAETARRTGQLVGLDDARLAVQSGESSVVDLSVRLRALPALVGWPVAALLTVGAATGRTSRR